MAVEQAIQAKMFQMAAMYTDGKERAFNEGLAQSFRLPFWSPFQGRATSDGTVNGQVIMGLSLLFCVRQVNVRRPNEKDYVIINNPLYAYKNPTGPELNAAFSSLAASEKAWIPTFLRTTSTGSIPLEAYTVRFGKKGKSQSDHVGLQENLSQQMKPGVGPAPGLKPWAPGMVYEDFTPLMPESVHGTIQKQYDAWLIRAAPARSNFLIAGLKAKLYACLTNSQSPLPNPPLAYAKFATRAFLDSQQV